jgi:hypothetical protein
MTTNAKEEFLEFTLSVGVGVSCARLQREWIGENPYVNEVEYLLKLGYTKEDYETFLNQLGELSYNSGYGLQELYGTIWFVDGTWGERREYDGSEWWEHQSCPSIPESLSNS